LVRPECLLLGVADRSPNISRFTGRVISSAYLGEAEQFLIEATGVMLRAVEPNPGAAGHPPGTLVALGLRADDAVVLPRESRP
jgi:hypothetical protein